MPEPIIFYDIPSKDLSPKAWSPNTWKTRFCLNFKGLPYKTVWVEYPDIEPVLRKLGVRPVVKNADGTPYYTVPAIYDPNTQTALAESSAIARYLDRAYPDTPRLIPAETDALHAAFDDALHAAILDGIARAMLHETAKHLHPRSEAHFKRSREAAFNVKDLAELAPPGPKRDEAWAAVKRGLSTFAGWMRADGSDKLFFLGEDRIAYADITIAGWLIWVRIVLGKESREWADLMAWDGGRWARFMAAFEKYEKVDGGEHVVV
ncbi:hypothetical protein GY45DRAFT_1316548 [Cubamyces sp. BRFM 1775]|nr:hypothetical protein GY45DRAFT_1316548 [Cubamyces sp. BRFM 1775]